MLPLATPDRHCKTLAAQAGACDAVRWVFDTSLFHQISAAPATSPNWTSGAVMIVLGVGADGVDAVAFRRRDLVGE